jgi:hypothetical protein
MFRCPTSGREFDSGFNTDRADLYQTAKSLTHLHHRVARTGSHYLIGLSHVFAMTFLTQYAFDESASLHVGIIRCIINSQNEQTM